MVKKAVAGYCILIPTQLSLHSTTIIVPLECDRSISTITPEDKPAMSKDLDNGFRALNPISCPTLAENHEQGTVLQKVNPRDASQSGKGAAKRQSSGLKASIFGLPDVLPEIWFFIASSSYVQFKKHEDLKTRELAIGSASQDVQKIHGIGTEFRGPLERCYFIDHSEYSPATAPNVLGGLRKRSGEKLAFIYIALHGSPGGQLGFMAANSPGETAGPEYVIHNAEICNILLASLEPGSQPLFLLTEACYTENLMELPYFLEFVNGVVQHGEVESGKKHDWDSRPPVVHMSATIPSDKAAYFKGGAAFTQAFNKLFKEPLKLGGLVEAMQLEVDKQLRKSAGEGNKRDPQHIRVYYSKQEALQADTLWSFMKFQLKPNRQAAI